MANANGLDPYGLRTCRCDAFGLAHRPEQCAGIRAYLIEQDDLERLDPLAPARGIVWGLIAGLVFWAIVLFPIWRRCLPNG